VPAEKRGIGFVFQDYALFPHLSVLDNVMFGLQTLPKKLRAGHAREILRMVGLAGFESRRSHQLSGGQQQRVALARALAPGPRLLLLDEPFSNLDALLRQEMRQSIRDLIKQAGTTAIFVTHDQEEALTFADRVAVMQNGRIDQIGTPEQIYNTPRTLFVAQFLGRTNLLLTNADGLQAETLLGTLRLHREAHGPVLLSLRPEHLTLESAPNGSASLAGTVLSREFRGHDITYRVQVGPIEWMVHTPSLTLFQPGDKVYVRALEPAVVLQKAGEPVDE
jgi:iron(III) transport system ATP-binding protein